MKPTRNIRIFFTFGALFLLILISSLVFTNYLLKRPDVQQYLIKDLCNRLGMDIKADKMELDIFGVTGVNLQNAKIQFRGTNRSIEAMSLNFRFSKWRVLAGDFIPVSVDIKHPVISLDETDLMPFIRKKGKGHFNISSLFTGGFRVLKMEDMEILVNGPSGIGIKNLSLKAEHILNPSNAFNISGNGQVVAKEKKSEFSIQGTVDIDPLGIRGSALKMTLKTDSTPLEWIPWPVNHVKMKKGLMDSAFEISGSTEKGINLNGTFKIRAANFILINKNRSKNFEVPSLNCALNASFKEKIIEVTSLKMKNRDLDLDLTSTIDLNDIDNPYFRLMAKSQFMPITIFSRYFPFHITSPWLEEKLFPLFEQGRVRIDELLLKGTSEQFKHISDEKNSSVISMTLTCESFTLANMGIQMPVSEVSATVDIRDNNLAVKNLTGVFGTSKVKDASVIVKGLTAPIPVFTIPVEGDFDIQELLTHRYLEVIPQTARERIDTYSGLSGRLSVKTVIGYQKDWKSPRILKGEFALTDTIYHKKFLDLPLVFNRISFHFPEDKTGSFDGNGLFGEMPFDVAGSAQISEYGLEFTGAEISGLTDMNSLTQAVFMPGKFPFRFRKGFPVKVTVTKEKSSYRYTGELDTRNLVMEADTLLINAVGRGNCISFDLIQPDSTRLLLNSIEIKIGKSLIALTGDYNLIDKRLNNLRIKGNELSVKDIEIRTGGKKNSFTGQVGCNLELSFPEKGMKRMYITGNITGKSLSLDKGLFPVSVSDLSFYMDLAGDKGFINQWDMKLDGHPLNMKGMVHGWNRVSAELLVTSEYMDLTGMIMGEDNNIVHREKIFNTPDIYLKINASGGVWRKLTFKHLNTEIKISDQDISIKNLVAELEKGNISIGGTIDRAESGMIDINGRIKLEKEPIDKLLSDTGYNKIGIKGTLTLDSSINIKGPKENGIVKNLSGKIDNLTMNNGLLKNSMVFLKILDNLNIPDKFTDRPPEMKAEKGFYFHILQGTGLIDKGVLKTEEFVMKSPAFNAVGSGEENLNLKTHNIRLLLQPLGNLDYIISHIPIVGRILVEDNETFFTVGYDVTGSWSKPKLDIVPTENLKGLIGVFKRALLTPVRIIENIGNAAKEISKPAPENKEKVDNEEIPRP
jgi:hypothetical protein